MLVYGCASYGKLGRTVHWTGQVQCCKGNSLTSWGVLISIESGRKFHVAECVVYVLGN